MTHNADAANLAFGSKGMDCALEAVERVRLSAADDLESFVIVVAARFTDCHGFTSHRVSRFQQRPKWFGSTGGRLRLMSDCGTIGRWRGLRSYGPRPGAQPPAKGRGGYRGRLASDR